VQNDMSTAVMWSKSKPDVEFQYGGHLGKFSGKLSGQSQSYPRLRISTWYVILVWRKGNINTVLCTIIMVHKDMSRSHRSVDYQAFILLALQKSVCSWYIGRDVSAAGLMMCAVLFLSCAAGILDVMFRLLV